METSTLEGKHGIQWIAWMQLDDLDFTNDLALQYHTHEKMLKNHFLANCVHLQRDKLGQTGSLLPDEVADSVREVLAKPGCGRAI
ncbi:unnamed protein product [Schistosoma margrebowiei]|uniref:Uncharacterized protein n=1 Tax=Schistosoma margrebowiei TaxID=48269 RepID=A0A183MLR9_9TREM|nr:unnamed protein product [Schistosoma margrebowiei]